MFTRHNTSVKIALYGLLLVIFYLLQSIPALGIRFMDMSPELLLVLTVCVAFRESETFAAFFGLAAGMLNDCVTESIVGDSALFFMFIAFFTVVALKTVLRKLFLTYVFLTLSALALFLLTEYLLTSLFFGAMPFWLSLGKVILPKFLLSGALSYPVYFIVWLLTKKLDTGTGGVGF